MSGIDDLPPLREVVETHGLAAKKSLGQNFLFDLNLTSRIARTAGNLEDQTVIEVGPGPGGLTRAILANGAKRVIAIERDTRCLPALQQIADHYPNKLEVIEADALTMDWNSLSHGNTKIIANLPYNIATPLLTGWLDGENWPPFFNSLTLMFQREVAERICAKAGDNHYGRLAVLSNWRAYTSKAFDVSREAFYPTPKVTSSIVHLEPRVDPLPCSVKKLETITRAAFGQRRKMLRSSLKSLGGEALLIKAQIDPTKRAEEIEISDFVALANLI